MRAFARHCAIEVFAKRTMLGSTKLGSLSLQCSRLGGEVYWIKVEHECL